MDAPERGALTLVRLIGVTLIVATILELGLYWAMCHNPKNPVPMEVLPVVWRLIPALIGTVVLIKSQALADWLADLLD